MALVLAVAIHFQVYDYFSIHSEAQIILTPPSKPPWPVADKSLRKIVTSGASGAVRCQPHSWPSERAFFSIGEMTYRAPTRVYCVSHPVWSLIVCGDFLQAAQGQEFVRKQSPKLLPNHPRRLLPVASGKMMDPWRKNVVLYLPACWGFVPSW